jgi:hypothetical protein
MQGRGTAGRRCCLETYSSHKEHFFSSPSASSKLLRRRSSQSGFQNRLHPRPEMGSFVKDRVRGHPRLTRISRPSYKYALAWPLCDPELGRPKIYPQAASPLFGKLSVELRILIYRAVLTEPTRFLHIIKHLPQPEKKHRPRRPMAHYWCDNMDLPFPTFQHHTCYHGDKTETNDNLLSVLLTCRAM